MPRPLWSGSLSFGLVNVPVRLVSASRDLDLHFRQLHDGQPIETQRWCSEEGKEVPYEEIARQFEFDDGDTVVVTDEELEGMDPERTRTIEISSFVDLEEVDPMYFDHPYLLVPAGNDEGALRAYRLLLEVMERADRAALGTFVMRTKQYKALVRARDGALGLTTMLMHDEVRPVDDVETGGTRKPAKGQLEQAVALVEALSVDWDPSRYEDHYRERLQAVVDSKRKGRTITAPEPVAEPSPVPDLMAALKESLAAVRGDEAKPKKAKAPKAKAKDDLAGLSTGELYERAQEEDVPGRSSMSKDELIEALR
jgi:DNA end-binding protein Ku